MSAFVRLQPFRDLPPQLRQTLSFGSAQRLQPSTPEGIPQVPLEPLPWPGVLHELFAVAQRQVGLLDGLAARFGPDHPFPAAAVIGFAVRQLEQSKGRLTVWIGRRAWPYPLVLERAGVLGGSLFVDAKDNNQRLWAAELALRCAAVATVIADGSGFLMSATRRLQLISRESGALMLLVRPSCDERQLSAAGARWRVAPAAAEAEEESPQWSIELLRCKGVRPASVSRHGQSHSCWKLGWDAERACTRSPATGSTEVPGGISVDVAGGPAAASHRAPIRRVG